MHQYGDVVEIVTRDGKTAAALVGRAVEQTPHLAGKPLTALVDGKPTALPAEELLDVAYLDPEVSAAVKSANFDGALKVATGVRPLSETVKFGWREAVPSPPTPAESAVEKGEVVKVPVAELVDDGANKQEGGGPSAEGAGTEAKPAEEAK